MSTFLFPFIRTIFYMEKEMAEFKGGLNDYIRRFRPEYAIRISEKNSVFESGIKAIPLYAVFCLTLKD